MDAGGYSPCMALFSNGLNGFDVNACHCLTDIPLTNMFWSKEGLLAMAKTCPVLGSMASAAPALPCSNYENIVNTIKSKTCLFIYYPDKKYMKKSEFANTQGKISTN